MKNLSKLDNEKRQQIKELLLDERGIKQEWIAKQFGVSQGTIAYYNNKLKEELLEQRTELQLIA